MNIRPYPEGTTVRLKKNGELAIIGKAVFLKDGVSFLHYLAEIGKRPGNYALYHNDIELESLTANVKPNELILTNLKHSST